MLDFYLEEKVSETGFKAWIIDLDCIKFGKFLLLTDEELSFYKNRLDSNGNEDLADSDIVYKTVNSEDEKISEIFSQNFPAEFFTTENPEQNITDILGNLGADKSHLIKQDDPDESVDDDEWSDNDD